MFYLGGVHSASEILKEQSGNIRSVDKAMIQKKMCGITRTLKEELQNNNVDAMGDLLHENWMLKKSLAYFLSKRSLSKGAEYLHYQKSVYLHRQYHVPHLITYLSDGSL